jgi:hypothetical protein
MSVEVRTEAEAWPIVLPNEDVYRDRLLEMRHSDGRVLGRWLRDEPCWRWSFDADAPGGYQWWKWHMIVDMCMSGGYSLVSCPRETGVSR